MNIRFSIYIISIITCIGLFYFISTSSNTAPNLALFNKGTVEIRVYPPSAILNIDNKIYSLRRGVKKIKLIPKDYIITATCPGFYSQDKKVSVKRNALTKISFHLLPVKWSPHTLIKNKQIIDFQLSPDNNQIIYITKEVAASKTKYHIFEFDRSTKQSKEVNTTNSPPIILDKEDKRIIYQVGQKYYLYLGSIHFEDLGSISKSTIELQHYLQKLFKEKLTETKKFTIHKVFFSPHQEDSLIIQTEQAIYNYEFLEDNLEQLVDQKVLFLTPSGSKLYYFSNQGILFSYNFNTKNIQQESLFVFHIDRKNPALIHPFVLNNSNYLLVLDSSQNLYLITKKDVPQLIAREVTDFQLSPENTSLLVRKKGNNSFIYDVLTSKKEGLALHSDKMPQWFYNQEYLLFCQGQTLYIYDRNQKKAFLVTQNIKDKQFQVDNSLRRIFYLDNEGIQSVSW
ncbi:hypothetical protein J7K70_01435 [bacterium]|nr:hypothetical protein [bacterium]